MIPKKLGGGGGGEAWASVELGGGLRAVQVGGNVGLVGRRRGHHCMTKYYIFTLEIGSG